MSESRAAKLLEASTHDVITNDDGVDSKQLDNVNFLPSDVMYAKEMPTDKQMETVLEVMELISGGKNLMSDEVYCYATSHGKIVMIPINHKRASLRYTPNDLKKLASFDVRFIDFTSHDGSSYSIGFAL